MFLNRIKVWFDNLKIKNRMMILLLIATGIPIMVLGFFSFNLVLEIIDNETNTYFASLVNQMTTNLDQTLSNIRSNAETIYGDRIIQKIRSC